MNENLLIITKYFPFNNGQAPAEAFFETEIYVLAQLYKKITVFALDAPKGSTLTVDLPDNVRAYAVGISKKQMMFQLVPEMLFSNMKDLRANTVRKRLYERYFNAKSNIYLKGVAESNVLDESQNYTIYCFWFYTYAKLAVELKKNLRDSKVFSRAHGYDLYEYRHKEDYIPMREYLLERLDFVFPCSEDGTKYLKERYGRFSDKIITSYLGSPNRGINCSSKEKQPFVIVSCSRIAPVKRVDKILEVITLLLQMELDISVQWIHIGDGKKLKEIKKQAKNLIERDRAVFLGNMPNKAVLEFYTRQHVDLFINLSDSEGLPISIMEASSFGIPVFATDVGGTSEVVENGVNGWLINHNFNAIQTAKQLKDIIYLLKSKEELIKYRTNARNIWKEKFLVEKNTEEMISVAEKK